MLGEILVRARRLDDSAGVAKFRIEVLDNGPGVPQEIKKRLFVAPFIPERESNDEKTITGEYDDRIVVAGQAMCESHTKIQRPEEPFSSSTGLGCFHVRCVSVPVTWNIFIKLFIFMHSLQMEKIGGRYGVEDNPNGTGALFWIEFQDSSTGSTCTTRDMQRDSPALHLSSENENKPNEERTRVRVLIVDDSTPARSALASFLARTAEIDVKLSYSIIRKFSVSRTLCAH